MAAIAQRMRGKKLKYGLSTFFSIRGEVQYYLKVDSAQLQMNVVHPRKNSKKKKTEAQLIK